MSKSHTAVVRKNSTVLVGPWNPIQWGVVIVVVALCFNRGKILLCKPSVFRKYGRGTTLISLKHGTHSKTTKYNTFIDVAIHTEMPSYGAVFHCDILLKEDTVMTFRKKKAFINVLVQLSHFQQNPGVE